MNLRLRLIVVFFLLSVVPLGAVTYYAYLNNAQAVRDAAGLEAELLAGELSESMRTVTAQLSQRVENLIEMPAASAPTSVAAPAAASGSADTPTSSTAVEASTTADAQLADRAQMNETLGDFAAMVNNIEFVGGRGFGRRGGRGPFQGQPGGRDGGPGGQPPGTPGGPPLTQGSQGGRTGGGFRDGERGGGQGRFGGPNGSDGRGGQGSGDGRGNGAAQPADPNRIRIDLGQVRRDMFDSLVPDRDAFEELSEEQRQEVFAKINERMVGVAQGIQVLQKEIASRVAVDVATQDATQAADQVPGGDNAARTAPAPAAVTAPVARAAAPTAPPAPAAPVAPAVPAAPPAPPAATERSAALSGNRLAVRVQRDGEVVGEVSADVDLSKLLATVFETTSRDRGELLFAVGEDGALYTPSEADTDSLRTLGTTALSAGTLPGTIVLRDWIVATTTDPAGSGLKFGIARPVGDALRELRQAAARNAGLGLGFIILALIGIVPLSARLTRNLDRLSAGVNRLSHGDYAARVEVRSNDEVGRLAHAFNQMAADVELHQRSAVEQERIRRELELGRQIQHDMLPRAPLRLGLTEVKGVSVPAREVGGDFFNYFQLQDGTLALLVGDVSGKGVGAALLMANIQAALRTRLSLGQDLASLAQELDLDIERSTPGPVYATLFVGILDVVNHRLRCVNAGHNPQYVLRRDRSLDRMESTGRPIGLFSGGGYTEQVFELEAGDVLFFYTDGCVEAENGSGEMFGSERLERILGASAGHGADEVLVAVEAEVSRFRAGVELQDDATMMVVKMG